MIIQSKKVWFNERFQPLQLEIEGTVIKHIMPYGEKTADADYKDNMILPGLVDIHNHGWNGNDTAHADKEWVKQWRKYMLTEGVTSFMPTSSTNDYQEILAGMRAVADAVSEQEEGAHVLGVYSEGPFIGGKPGAQPPAWKVIPTVEIIDEFNRNCGGLLKYVMLAPEELNGNYEVIEYCVRNGIRVAIGHSNASYDVCEAAIRAGATSFTHTFNGMLPFTNRNQSCVASAMYHKDLYAELIGDGSHVDKITAKIFADIKGKDKLISVTDSTRVKGWPVGEYELWGKKFRVCEDGICRLPNGTISGSCHKYYEILKSEIEDLLIDQVTAINSCTVNPLRMLGIENKGLIRVGYDADIAVLNSCYEPEAVYLMGGKVL